MKLPSGLSCAAILALCIPVSATAAAPQKTVQKAKQPGKTVEEIAEVVTPSLVKVMQVGREGMDGLGAGFVIRSDGLIATNKHVIGEARLIQVETSDGEKHDVTEVYASDVHLDLAILRIAKTGMKPLALGDSKKVKQGAPVVAMGNPAGLDFSVVEGVVSAVREIDDIPMIQVAMPIERGNSGGPLLDRQGRVLGLLTLKSVKTENLGFAMPVNDLKRLVSKPNPVPMSRWLTIGVLDRLAWKPMMGAQWTQHAGVIKSTLMGDGFGGRSLCLWMADEPPRAFEAAVSVRLADEEGAAGLIFCADGGDRHYGFYPSNGKLRLTRFEGAFVDSWTVLAEIETDAYKRGDWNALRVRVDETRIKCFVNGRQVIEQEDAGLRGGRAGLCKFRLPTAEFRSFRIGTDLADKQIAPEVAEGIKQSLGAFLDKKTSRQTVIDHLLDDPSAGRRLLIEQRKALEQDASSLRELERDLHRSAVARELARQLGRKDEKVDLLRCALLVAKHDNPEIDVEQYHRSFARLVDELKNDADIKKDTPHAVKRLSKFLFQENGFHGSRHDYGNNSNSYINEVLDDREGLPITLAVVYLECAARLGVKNVVGLSFPGQFMVGYRESEGADLRVVDVFEGGREMTTAQASAMLSRSGLSVDEFMEPADRKSIIVRMIRNLLRNAQDDEQEARENHTKATADSMPYLNLLLALDPDAMSEHFARAVLRDTRGDKAGAREDVGWLIEHPPEGLPADQAERLARWYESLAP
ncbi:MAG: trypsin-like peptidase domain-containing protein [Verrucomicrobiaceae bacterium]|nr:trypsin-like peptidase domain-containing protein [Verrucomicrobiaceae bacterium]